MLDLLLGAGDRKTLRVLCIGAHCDDIEIGCGGTLLALQRKGLRLSVDWAILSGSTQRRAEALSAMRKLIKPGHRNDLLFGEFTDGRLPAEYSALKDYFEGLKRRPRPDVIFCHERGDRHQDHRIVNEMVWSGFRNQLILEYEVPKWGGGLGQPNCYVPIGVRHARRKVDILLSSHSSQAAKDWFTRDTFMAMLRLRGLECRSPTGYAEAFHGRKLRLGIRR